MNFFSNPSRLLSHLKRLGAEEVLYTPADKSGVRTVWAIVDRMPGVKHFAAPNITQARLAVTVVNDPALGIPSDHYNSGTDTITTAMRTGGTPEDFSITGEPVRQDAGMLTLLLR